MMTMEEFPHPTTKIFSIRECGFDEPGCGTKYTRTPRSSDWAIYSPSARSEPNHKEAG